MLAVPVRGPHPDPRQKIAILRAGSPMDVEDPGTISLIDVRITEVGTARSHRPVGAQIPWYGPVVGLSQLTSKPFVISASRVSVVKLWPWAWTGGNGGSSWYDLDRYATAGIGTIPDEWR